MKPAPFLEFERAIKEAPNGEPRAVAVARLLYEQLKAKRGRTNIDDINPIMLRRMLVFAEADLVAADRALRARTRFASVFVAKEVEKTLGMNFDRAHGIKGYIEAPLIKIREAKSAKWKRRW